MRNWVSLGTVAVACLAAAVAATPAVAADGLRAGAASADITPPIGTPMFAYTARSAVAGGHVDRPMQIVADPDHNLYAKSFVPSRGIHQRLKARAIVLERAGLKYALVQTDLGGVPYALTNEVAKRVASAGFAEERILLSATHTHSGTGPIWPADNGGYAALGGDLFDPRIFELTVQGVTEAILAADQRLQAARLGVGTVDVRDASRNRAFDPFKLNEDVPKDEAGARAASIDPALSVVRVDDSAGKPIGVWSNFAIHATSFGDGNLLFSGDNPGYAEELVERELTKEAGGREVVNVWTNGNEGDISPNGGPDSLGGQAAQHVPSSFASADMAGRRVAAGILSAWRAAGDAMTAAPDLRARTTYLNFDGTPADGEPVGPVPVLGAGIVSEGMCARFDNMAGPGQGKKFPGLAGVGLVPNIHPISMWKIGGLGVASFGSEITKQMGERIRRGLERQGGGAYDRVALAGLTNSYFSYTATPEEYDACRYEGSFTLFGRRQGARLLDVAKTVNQAVLSGDDAPAGIAPPALGVGTTAAVPPRKTADAGEIETQPALRVDRLGRAQLRWQGGDPSVDAPRGATFVRLQRRDRGKWQTVSTDAASRDTVERFAGDEYLETVQFTECDPIAAYRLVVTGRADRGSGVEPYTLTSRAFSLDTATLTATEPSVSGGVARFRATYPSPGADALLALPRLVRTGEATLRVTAADGRKRTVTARPGDDGVFSAQVGDATAVDVIDVTDACGNRTP
jgi:neutral ceramidase